MLFLGNGFIFTLQTLRVKGTIMLSCFLFPLAVGKLRARMWLIPSRCWVEACILCGNLTPGFILLFHTYFTFLVSFPLKSFIWISPIYLKVLFVELQDFSSFLEKVDDG